MVFPSSRLLRWLSTVVVGGLLRGQRLPCPSDSNNDDDKNSNGARTTSPPSSPPHRRGTSVVLLLDVDNTLYDETTYRTVVGGGGIERQIVDNIHRYCSDAFNMTRAEADELHRTWGSTAEGLRQRRNAELRNDARKSNNRLLLGQFYRQVYDDVDVSCLLLRPDDLVGADGDSDSSSSSSPSSTTGYSYSNNNQNTKSRRSRSSLKELKQQQDRLRRTLLQLRRENVSLGNTISSWQRSSAVLASNSPRRHVSKVVQALGLCRVPWVGMLTPDHRDDDASSPSSKKKRKKGVLPYPTKADPREFYEPLVSKAPRADAEYVLIDDSEKAIEMFLDSTDLFPRARGILVNAHYVRDGNDHRVDVVSALSMALGWIDPGFVFDEIRYLKAKNDVDLASVNRETWKLLRGELRKLLLENDGRVVRVVDVGAGLLPMLKLFLFGYSKGGDKGENDQGLPSLLGTLYKNSSTKQVLRRVEYYAYEPNRRLERECCQGVLEQELGFHLQTTYHWGSDDDPEHVYHKKLDHGTDVVVHLRMWDFQKSPSDRGKAEEPPMQPTPHLVVGCCFADLFKDPMELTRLLVSRFLSRKPTQRMTSNGTATSEDDADSHFSETLVYFPITFRGVTQFMPPRSFKQSSPINDDGDGSQDRVVPSDTAALKVYSKCLAEDRGHNLDPDRLVEAVQSYGGVCLSRRSSSSSDWVIDPCRNVYLWESMLYFFGAAAGWEIHSRGWNANAWLDRARSLKPTIRACNCDLLFRVPHLGDWNISATHDDAALLSRENIPKTYREIEFEAPSQVSSKTRMTPTQLEPRQVMIRTVNSLISSGTELKIFKGDFDQDVASALDVNIKGLEEERMAYPLTYGYCLVGRVMDCGDEVQDAHELMGKLVFAFAPHASLAIVDRDALQVVPRGIGAVDAIFMPSMETALSIVHDANPRFGESVVVFGQGLVGLLVTAILGRNIDNSPLSSAVVPLTTVDSLPTRLATSALLGSTQALLPSEVLEAAPFDVAIEVSGNPKALQSAIDLARDGGQIIIGSWYGNSGVDLKLGIDFHRSHKKLKVSQVSEIPAELRATWDKQRRFRLAWELVRAIRPSQHLLTRVCLLDDAQEAYEALDRGRDISIAFSYEEE